jgi:hypothetical protein
VLRDVEFLLAKTLGVSTDALGKVSLLRCIIDHAEQNYQKR